MEIIFFIPVEKFTLKDVYGPDIDNLVKRLLDGLNNTLFRDLETKDGSVIDLKVTKKPAIGDQKPGAKVTVFVVDEPRSDQESHYFSYGSNMSTKRMKDRIPEARNPKVVCMPSFRLMTNKISTDGSGKANLAASSDKEMVWGVMWTLPKERKEDLDGNEGGYHPKEAIVFDAGGNPYRVYTYIANGDRESIENLEIFDWYRSLILNGAREHGLPANYIALLESLPWRIDPDDKRRRKNCSEC